MLLICHVTSRDYLLQELHYYGWKSHTVNHDLAMCGGRWSSTSRDITYLIYHVTSLDNMTEYSCDLMGGRSSLHVNTLVSLLATDIMIVEI